MQQASKSRYKTSRVLPQSPASIISPESVLIAGPPALPGVMFEALPEPSVGVLPEPPVDGRLAWLPGTGPAEQASAPHNDKKLKRAKRVPSIGPKSISHFAKRARNRLLFPSRARRARASVHVTRVPALARARGHLESDYRTRHADAASSASMRRRYAAGEVRRNNARPARARSSSSPGACQPAEAARCRISSTHTHIRNGRQPTAIR